MHINRCMDVARGWRDGWQSSQSPGPSIGMRECNFKGLIGNNGYRARGAVDCDWYPREILLCGKRPKPEALGRRKKLYTSITATTNTADTVLHMSRDIHDCFDELASMSATTPAVMISVASLRWQTWLIFRPAKQGRA